MDFEWDVAKARLNLSKHAVSFEEGQTVFDDPLYVMFSDPDHSKDENRFIILGESERRELLVVSYTERAERVRLISARAATRKERKAYEGSL